MSPLAAEPEQFYIIGREIDLRFPTGYRNTRLSNPAIERNSSMSTTARNWPTTKSLLSMAQ
jgi:uncharacterized protein (DUF1697 family)